jgi:hypothetical protein
MIQEQTLQDPWKILPYHICQLLVIPMCPRPFIKYGAHLHLTLTAMSPLHIMFQLYVPPTLSIFMEPLNNGLPYVHVWIDHGCCQNIPVWPPIFLYNDTESAIFVETPLVNSKSELFIVFGCARREDSTSNCLLSTL